MLRTFPSVVSEMVLCWVGSVPPVSLWSPEVTDRSEPNCIGALLPNNNTGEVSAFYHALKWIRVSDGISSKPVCRRLNTACASSETTPSRRDAIKGRPTQSVPIMTLPSPGSRYTRAALLPKHWEMRRLINLQLGAALAPQVR